MVKGGFAKAVASELSFEGWTGVDRQTGRARGQRAGPRESWAGGARGSARRRQGRQARKAVRRAPLDRGLQLVPPSRLSQRPFCGDLGPVRVPGGGKLEIRMSMATLASECPVKRPVSCL